MMSGPHSGENSQWTGLLRRPDLSSGLPEEEIYRAACIGAVMLLYEAGDADSLQDAVRRAAAPESRARALLALENMAAGPSGKRAARLLHELAVLDGNPEAAAFLRRRGLQDEDAGWNSARMLLFGQKHQLLKEDPGLENLTHLFLHADPSLCRRLLTLGEKVLPNWTLFMAFLDSPSDENRERLLSGFRSFSPDERKLLHVCAGFEPAVSSAAADILLRCEDETLKKICVENHLLPSDPSQQALYFFLSGQWEQYYKSDSDYRSIRIAYEQKDPDLQRRLIAVSRDSGNSAWLRDIHGSSENQPHSGTLSDQHLLVKSLTEQKQWERLWELLPNLPLLCMEEACRALSEARFTPPQAEEKNFFAELCRRIAACKDLSPIPVRDRLLSGGGTAIGICGGGPYAAVLFSDRRILVWDKRSDYAEPVRITSDRLNFRSAVISRDGKYLCADCGNDGISIFSLPGGQPVKSFAAGSSRIAGLYLHNGDRRLLVIDQKGTGTVYAFPGGTELKQFSLGINECSRSAFDPENSHVCGMTMDGDCSVYDLGGFRPLNAVRIEGSLLAAPELICSSRLPCLMRDETLSVINLLSGKNVLEKIDLTGQNVRRLMFLAGSDLFALGTLDGQIRVHDPYAGRCHAVLSFGSKSAVTGMFFDDETSILYGCNSAGTVRSWDLSLFREMGRVLPLMQLPGISRIDEFTRKYPEPGVKAAAEWLKTVIAWRRRFDIEIDF